MKVSVCMATYNGEKYIKEQVESILVQLSDKDELIISDDNSTDKTLEIIKKLKDNRIKIYLNKSMKGYVSNFENALKKATGDIIFFSDQDDIWLPNKLTKCIKELENNDLVVTNARVIDENMNIIEESLFNVVKTKTGLINNLIKNRYYGCCMAFNKKILEKVLPFPQKYKICTHDIWIPIICELYYSVGLIEEPLLLYRRHNNNVSCFKKSNNSLLKKFLLRIYPLYKAIFRVNK